jgi:superfamily II DNA/RNA helicase
LKGASVERTLVFTRTKHGADKVVRGLVTAGIAAEAIHGNKSQNQRERVLAAFRQGSVRTLVATDIAARGIDVDGISHVVNYDLPNIPESYVHRIGRTARAGAAGVAISLCEGEEASYLRDIEKLIRMAIPATDQRSSPRPRQQPLAEGGNARPSTNHRSGKRQQRSNGPQRHGKPHERPAASAGKGSQSRNGAPRGQQPPRRQPDEPRDGISAVAFLQRDTRHGRNAQRPPR